MGTGSFPEVKCGRGVLLTTNPLLVSRSWKSRAIPVPTHLTHTHTHTHTHIYIYHTFVFLRLLHVVIAGNLSVLGTKQAFFILKVDCKVRDGVNGPNESLYAILSPEIRASSQINYSCLSVVSAASGVTRLSNIDTANILRPFAAQWPLRHKYTIL